jgi:ketosteroid isomerase-like protein
LFELESHSGISSSLVFTGENMLADKKTEAEVIASLNLFISNYNRKDLEGTLAQLAPDQDLMIIGTGADQVIVGIQAARTLLKQDFEQAASLSVKLGKTVVSAAASVAWITTDSNWQVNVSGREMSFDWRWTLVMEKRHGAWLIQQSHLSAPEVAQPPGLSFPLK